MEYVSGRLKAVKASMDGSFGFSSALTVFNRVFSVFFMGLMFVLVARFLGPANQGIVASLVAVITIAIQFGNLGLYASNIRFVGADRSLFRKAAENSLTAGLALGIALIFIVGASYHVIPGIYEGIGFSLLLLYALSLPFSIVTVLLQGMLLAVKEIVAYNILITFRSVFLVFGSATVLLALDGGVSGLIAFLVLAEIVFALLHIAAVYRVEPFGFGIDMGFLKKIVSYGVRVYLATQLTYLVFKFDVLMVNQFLGNAEAGVYSVSSKIADIIKLAPETVALIYFPYATVLGKKARGFTNKVLFAMGLLMSMICFGVYLTAQPAIMTIFGIEYSESINPVIILLPGLFFISLAVILMNYFAAKDMPWKIVLIPFIGVSANIWLNILWLPQMGIAGAAWASTAVYALMFAMMLFAYFIDGDIKRLKGYILQ
jgi:O-antigen/teichoic acid export membrane protein